MTKSQTQKPRTERLEMAFLGVPEIRFKNRTIRFRTRKTVPLLAYLMLEPGLRTREKLVALFWSQSLDNAGRASLRNALTLINRELDVLHANLDAIAMQDADSYIRLARRFSSRGRALFRHKH